jgi:hypothetical protein
MNNVTVDNIERVEANAGEAVKAALLISGADKLRYGKLKDKLANNYLLRSDHYLDKSHKVLHILGNYQMTRSNAPFRASQNDRGVSFQQQGSQAGQRGCGEEEMVERREMAVPGEPTQVPDQAMTSAQ